MKGTLRKGIAIAIYMVFIVAVVVYQSSQNITSYAYSEIPSGDAQTALLLANDLRVEKNLSPLSWNENLANAASDKASDLVSNNYFNHVSPTGTTPWKFILENGYDYKFAGENLAVDYSSVKEATLAWKNSPSHYANIVSDKYSELGFAKTTGVIDGKQVRVYVQMFGSEMSAYDRVFAEMEGGNNVN